MREEIEKLYYNQDKLNDDFKDLDSTKESKEKLDNYLAEQKGKLFTSNSIFELDDYLMDLCSENEKQGFIYGFEYAVRLLVLPEKKED